MTLHLLWGLWFFTLYANLKVAEWIWRSFCSEYYKLACAGLVAWVIIHEGIPL